MNLEPKLSFAERIGQIEDRLAIYNLIEQHPPRADTRQFPAELLHGTHCV